MPPLARALAVVTLLALLVPATAGCTSAGSRGYYFPEGQPPETLLVFRRESTPEATLEIRCQGMYTNSVDGWRVRTVHVQLEVARARDGDLILPRDGLAVEFRVPGSAAPLRLPVTATWSGRDRMGEALVVPGWTRRAFDLFFDDRDLVGLEPPTLLAFSWSGRAPEGPFEGRTAFERLPPDDPRVPGDMSDADLTFGLRRGYYLPGPEDLGPRELQASAEDRLHYVFHRPGGWWPW